MKVSSLLFSLRNPTEISIQLHYQTKIQQNTTINTHSKNSPRIRIFTAIDISNRGASSSLKPITKKNNNLKFSIIFISTTSTNTIVTTIECHLHTTPNPPSCHHPITHHHHMHHYDPMNLHITPNHHYVAPLPYNYGSSSVYYKCIRN